MLDFFISLHFIYIDNTLHVNINKLCILFLNQVKSKNKWNECKNLIGNLAARQLERTVFSVSLFLQSPKFVDVLVLNVKWTVIN